MNNIDQLHRPFVLISAYTKDCTESGNRITHEHLKRDLETEGFIFKEVEGCYKGRKELSLYVDCPDLDSFAELHKIAQSFAQESVLCIDKHRKATLIYLNDGTAQTLGKLKQVSKHEALQQDNYTHDFTNNGYYVCEK